MNQLASELISSIYQGAMDDQIDGIYEALNARRKYLQARKSSEVASMISVGDRVRLTDVKPKYLVGVMGEAVAIEGGKAKVMLDRGVGRYHNAAPVGCPFSILEKVS